VPWPSSGASGDPWAEVNSRCLCIKLAVRNGKFGFGHRCRYREAINEQPKQYRRAIHRGCRSRYWGEP
jgi:hypothetical protein